MCVGWFRGSRLHILAFSQLSLPSPRTPVKPPKRGGFHKIPVASRQVGKSKGPSRIKGAKLGVIFMRPFGKHDLAGDSCPPSIKVIPCSSSWPNNYTHWSLAIISHSPWVPAQTRPAARAAFIKRSKSNQSGGQATRRDRKGDGVSPLRDKLCDESLVFQEKAWLFCGCVLGSLQNRDLWRT